jgi:hypothetical protein
MEYQGETYRFLSHHFQGTTPKFQAELGYRLQQETEGRGIT